MARSPGATLEALLFAAGEPLSKKKLCALLGVSPDLLEMALNQLRADLDDRGLALVEVNDDVELRTHPETFELTKKLREAELSRDLGKAGLETLAVIVYRGQATRGHIDWVRGVNSGAALRSLLMRGLVKRVDDPSDKRRACYEPTVDALAHIGVSSLTELPEYQTFKDALAKEEVRQTASETIHDTA